MPNKCVSTIIVGALAILGVACAPAAATSSATSSPSSSAVAFSASDLALAKGLEAKTVVQGLENPWAVAWLPDATMLVTERRGTLRLVRQGVLVAEAVKGVPPVLVQGQGGLMDVAVDPDFATTQRLFFTYATGEGDNNMTALASAVYRDGALTAWKELWRNPVAKSGGQHFGSRLLFLEDKTLLMSVGDGGNPPVMIDGSFIRERAQMQASAFGKVLRLNRDGSAPADNPFAAKGGEASFVWSYGHRNIQGLAQDAKTAAVFATEHGARGGDELNAVMASANYGWPKVTYSKEYSGPEITTERSGPGFKDPLLVWQSAIAPSGLAVYRGNALPGFDGALMAGGLRSSDVRIVQLDSAGKFAAETRLPIGARVREVRQGPDGFVYVLTDGRGVDGRLVRIVPAPAPEAR